MDGTQFEKLCSPVLRKMVPELKNLIPSGLNADGRVIKSLSDGFCFVDNAHFATAHYTTNTSNLQKKWLYNGNARTTPKGDLIKSIVEARKMQSEKSDYKFTVFLVYNRQVDESLHKKVNETISDEFISVKIIEQRDLVQFLDNEPEGQYLRKHLLGIDAIRISESLLKDIIKTNLFRYAQEFYFEDSFLTVTSVQKKVENNLESSTKTINLLTGDSGFGKSTVCYSIMHSAIEKGKATLRVHPSVIESSVSFRDAIKAQLKLEYPSIYIMDEDIDNLFQSSIIIIDDINKSDKPGILLEKIISWCEIKQKASICWMCPVWPQNLKNLDNTLQKRDKFSNISLDRLSFYDCKAIIERRINRSLIILTEQHKHALILNTGFDPLLINFGLELLKDGQQYDEKLPGMAIGSYASDKINKITNQYQKIQITRALALFGRNELKNRRLDPTFFEVEQWLGRGSEELQIINLIAKHRQLFLFDDEGKIYFRHDRVRDYLLSLSIGDQIEKVDENKDIFEEPYYAEIIGKSLADSNMSKEAVESLVLYNPLAVIYSLKYLQENSSEEKRQTAMAAIQMWRSSVAIELIPKAVVGNIAYALLGFDVKEIHAITNGFPKSAELDLAKFRNGIWLSAVFFFSSVDYFYPEASTYWWNSILAHTKAKYQDKIIEELGPALSIKFTPRGIIHAYTLVGYLGENILLNHLEESWKKFKAPQNYPAYLWAILNSVIEADRDAMINALSYWSTLTSEEKSMKLLYANSSSHTILEQITRTHWEFSDQVFSVIVDICKDENLQEIISLLFERIDHPLAMEIVLNVEMGKDMEEHILDFVAGRWNYENTNRKLSNDTLNYLFQEFSNIVNNKRKRYLAWRYWTANIGEKADLTTIRNVIEQGDPLFEKVLIWRIINHDTTALSTLEELITVKPWLIKLFEMVWNEKSKSFFINWLEKQIQSENSVAIVLALELLQRLDNEDACQILIEHWKSMKFAKNAIETALFLSTSETRVLADKEIKRLGYVEGVPMPPYYSGNMTGVYVSSGDGLSDEEKQNLLMLTEQLGRLSLHYGMKYTGEQERLTIKKMESLLPYLTLFDEHDIYQFASKCLRIGAKDLCFERFYPLMDGHLRSRIRFTSEDLRRDIIHKYNQLAQMKEAPMSTWIEDPDKHGITPEMLNRVLINFSEEFHNENAFFIIAHILERVGNRTDIPIMQNFFPDFEKQTKEVRYWKENAIFSIKRRSLN